MSLSRPATFILMSMFFLSVNTAAASDESSGLGHRLKPALGQPVTGYPGSIVSPDGSGLPAGSGTVAAGKSIYAKHCAACHGVDGRQPGNRLAGGVGSLASNRPMKTVGSFWPYATTLYDYIARAMPYNQEKMLSADDTYAVTAYILRLNSILDDDAMLDAITLTLVKMPNQDGFMELIQ